MFSVYKTPTILYNLYKIMRRRRIADFWNICLYLYENLTMLYIKIRNYTSIIKNPFQIKKENKCNPLKI